MRFAAIDPSLTKTGWCVAEPRDQKIAVVESGGIKSDEKLPLDERIFDVTEKLTYKLEKMLHDDSVVVIETPSVRATGRHKGGGHGLAYYGMAVGAVWLSMVHAMGKKKVVTVDADLWIGGRTKDQLWKIAISVHPLLVRVPDPGRDLSDAIALALWWHQLGQNGKRLRSKKPK